LVFNTKEVKLKVAFRLIDAHDEIMEEHILSYKQLAPKKE